MADFNVVWDVDQEKDVKGSVPAVRFHGRNVHLMIAPFDDEGDGIYMINQGQIVLWCTLKGNTLSLALLDRYADNDSMPKIIIPLGLVIDKDWSVATSSNGNYTKGKMVLKTSCSINTLVTTKPTKITIWLAVDDMREFDGQPSEHILQ